MNNIVLMVGFSLHLHPYIIDYLLSSTPSPPLFLESCQQSKFETVLFHSVLGADYKTTFLHFCFGYLSSNTKQLLAWSTGANHENELEIFLVVYL